MHKHIFTFSAAIAALSFSLIVGFLEAKEKPASSKPNVILIMADDLGYECLGANGSTSYKTPVLDSLAAGGIRFENCYAQPLCTPTRAQLMTGKYNVRNYTVFGELHRSQETFGNLFRNAGYATSMVGKWQLGADAELPKHFGFDDYCLWQLQDRPSRYANPGLEINGEAVDYSNGEYGPDLVLEHAINFIDKNKDRPFFIYYPMLLTHSPFQPTPKSEKWSPTPANNPNKSAIEHFPDMVSYMDYLIGRLIAKLDETGLRNNTLVIFLGDNGTGGEITSECNGKTIVGGKGQMKDAGTHVPLIVSAPGLIKKPGVCGDLVDTTDFLPTICEAAGITVPKDFAVDGRSFYPQVMGQTGNPRDWVYFWFLRRGQEADSKPWIAARDKRYRLYESGDFYDVIKDSLEKEPISEDRMDEQQKSVRATLQSALNQFQGVRPDWTWNKKSQNPSPEDDDDAETSKKRNARRQQKQSL